MSLDPALALEVQMISQTQAMRNAEERGNSEVRRLYAGAVVFVTGGTGFLGKQLMEKLFRSCRDIKKMYLLSRCKKGKSMEERLTAVLQDPVYDELRKVCPDFRDRIVLVEGDVNQLNLGIKAEDWQLLSQEVNFIYHVAATVRFDEPLKTAILTNVRGTREIIKLARDCHNLRSMVYISTAYSHCNRTELREQFYESPIAPNVIIDFVESMDEKKLNAIEAKLIEDWPNTYTYSKAVAEETIRVMGQGLPICVIRPAIVTPAFREPMPGWLDISNCNGPSGVILGTGIGVIRTIWVNMKVEMDLVPVDYVNNLAITASWETANSQQNGNTDIKIYTLSRKRNTIIWDQMQRFIEIEARKLISPKAIWYGFSMSTPCKFLYIVYSIFLHFIPALLVDTILSLMGNKLRLLKVYQKVYKLNTILKYFLFNSWIHHDDNTQKLIPLMSKTDREIFTFDMANINLREFMSVWCLGLRKYIIKDGLKDTEYAIKKQAVLKYVNIVVLVLYFCLIWKVLSFSYSALSFVYSSVF